MIFWFDQAERGNSRKRVISKDLAIYVEIHTSDG